MPTYTFQQVRAQRTLTGLCPVCGKKARRSRTFVCTINPFNRNEDGTVRTYREVYRQAQAEADEWVPDFTHDPCAVEQANRSSAVL